MEYIVKYDHPQNPRMYKASYITASSMAQARKIAFARFTNVVYVAGRNSNTSIAEATRLYQEFLKTKA